MIAALVLAAALTAPGSAAAPQVTHGPGWVLRAGTIHVGAHGRLHDISTHAPIVVEGRGAHIWRVRDICTCHASPIIALGGGAQNTRISRVRLAGTDTRGGTALVGIKDVTGRPVTVYVYRANISRASSGVQFYRGLLAHSFIHNLGNSGGQHLEDFNSTGNGGAWLRIIANTLWNQEPQTAALYLGADFTATQNVRVAWNHLAGGGYTVYGGGRGVGPRADPRDVVIVHNTFSRRFFPRGGRYGPVAYYDSGHGDRWAGNRWAGGGVVRP